jgi:two-component system, cell cycle response regulator DivK
VTDAIVSVFDLRSRRMVCKLARRRVRRLRDRHGDQGWHAADGPVGDRSGDMTTGSRCAMPRDHLLVLLVDNDADNREMYAEYLQIRGFRVISCSDSRASIDVARRSQPDIILLELRMTGMTGIQVLRELRKEAALAHVPVVALTASVMTRERVDADVAGFTELLPKPFLPQDLAIAVRRIVTTAGAIMTA